MNLLWLLNKVVSSSLVSENEAHNQKDKSQYQIQ